jgi:predicted transcriptional regulator
MSFALNSHSPDSFDFAILRILQQNNRMALQEIGRAVNLSSAAVQRRVRRMEDDQMAPTHATKAGIRYRYYVSLPCLHGAAKTAKVASVTRVPAANIEDVVVKSLSQHLKSRGEAPALGIVGHSPIAELIDRIEVYKDKLAVQLKPRQTPAINRTRSINPRLRLWCRAPRCGVIGSSLS